MDRLTKRLPDGKTVMDCDSCKQKKYKQCTLYECRASLIKQLAAYEDTGLMPERCAEFARADAEGRYIVMRDAEQEGVARLRELAEADKDGRCVVLPCKVGDKLFRVFAGEIFEHQVASMKYFAIQGKWDIDAIPFLPHVESSIGKTVFLTREESERALQEMEGRKEANHA